MPNSRITDTGTGRPGNTLHATNKKDCPKAAFFVTNRLLAVGDVHRYFKAKTHFGVFGFGPHC
jgi:hypothetical protein